MTAIQVKLPSLLFPDMQVFSGSTNLLLSQKLANVLKIKLGKVEITQFPNQEIRVWVNEPKIDKQVIIVQSLAGDPNKATIEFCLLVDALKRKGAVEIIAVIPWLGYCIQDKIFRTGEPLSAKIIADLLQSVHPAQFITLDLHNDTIQGFFNTPIAHLSAVPLFIDYFNKSKKIDVVVAPDIGALKETSQIANHLDIPMVVINKERDLKTGQVKIKGIDGEVKGKKALIMDDFISTGSTLIQTAEYLKKMKVKHITVAVTHHLFVKGVQRKLVSSDIDELFITDTIMPPVDEEFKSTNSLKVKVFSVAPLIAKSLK